MLCAFSFFPAFHLVLLKEVCVGLIFGRLLGIESLRAGVQCLIIGVAEVFCLMC